MPQTNKEGYTAEKQERYEEVHYRLREIIWFNAPSAAVFRRLLDEALATGFPIDLTNKFNETLLHLAINYSTAVRAGLPQILIKAGADVNNQSNFGSTPLGDACWQYVHCGELQYLPIINMLLAAGARPELDESWKNRNWGKPEERARRDRLKAYIDTWPARRAERDRAQDAAPAFDYAL